MKLFILSLILLCLALEVESAEKKNGAECYFEMLPSVADRPGASPESVCRIRIREKILTIRDFASGFRPELATLSQGVAESTYSLASSGGGYIVGNGLLAPNSSNLRPAPHLLPAFEAFLEKNKKPLEQFLAQASPLLATSSPDLIAPGIHHFSAQKIPYRGYWWPMKGSPIADGPQSPLGKFDLVLGLKATIWEKETHHHPEEWSGHCNGWAAASILFAEPTFSLEDPTTKISFSPGDLKALLTESSFCVSYLFFGERYDSEANDPLDIKPALFHRVLTQFLRDQKKAVVIDTKPLEEVYNFVASAVDFEISSPSPEKIRVRANVTLHSYDGDSYGSGPAPGRNKIYEYELPLSQGEISGDGEWLSDNPDFVWVPLASKDCGAERENPFLQNSLVSQILALPRK